MYECNISCIGTIEIDKVYSQDEMCMNCLAWVKRLEDSLMMTQCQPAQNDHLPQVERLAKI